VSDYLGSVMAILTVAASIIVATIPTRAAGNDAQLLKDAQRVFKSLPREAIAGYTKMFQRAFPDEQDALTADNWGKAIGAYERTLITPSRFDEYLTGRTEALSQSERQGLRTFMNTGCSSCHNGVAWAACSESSASSRTIGRRQVAKSRIKDASM